MNPQFLKRPEGAIAYDDTGSGPLIVCAPSMGDVRGEYRFLAPQLVAAGHRVVTMDLRGLGESSTGWADYSVAGVGSDLVPGAGHYPHAEMPDVTGPMILSFVQTLNNEQEKSNAA